MSFPRRRTAEPNQVWSPVPGRGAQEEAAVKPNSEANTRLRRRCQRSRYVLAANAFQAVWQRNAGKKRNDSVAGHSIPAAGYLFTLILFGLAGRRRSSWFDLRLLMTRMKVLSTVLLFSLLDVWPPETCCRGGETRRCRQGGAETRRWGDETEQRHEEGQDEEVDTGRCRQGGAETRRWRDKEVERQGGGETRRWRQGGAPPEKEEME